MKVRRAFFINLEGIDNSGKTRLIKDIRNRYSKDYQVCVTEELTTEVGEYISAGLRSQSLDVYEKVLLFAADRQKRFIRDIEPILSEECLILSDRWFFSAIAYRCAENPETEEYVRYVNTIFPKPDITFFVDITAEESIKRGEKASKENSYSKEFLEKALREYRKLSEEFGFILIDGMRNYDLIAREIVGKVDSELASRKQRQ